MTAETVLTPDGPHRGADPRAAGPQPGDVVTIARTIDGTADRRAIIDGSHFGIDFDDGKGPLVLAVCSASAFRGPSISRANPADDGPEYVSVSGGPCPFIPLAELVPAGRTVAHFWRWKDMPRKDGGIEYTLEVNAWTWPEATA